MAPATFRFWKPSDGRAIWTSDGVRIAIAPAPCGMPPQTEGCRWDPQNNQAEVTVTSTGVAPVTVRTDDQSSFYRVAVVRFDATDPRPGVVIENESGGSAGNVRVQLLLPSGSGYREATLPGYLQGELPATLTDISGDGAVDFILRDGGFGDVFGCNACTPRPPVVLTVRGGISVDVSREPAYAAVFREDMARLRPICLSNTRYRNGACAAYVADAARIGGFHSAWAEILHHWDREENDLWQSCDVPYSEWTDHRCPPGKGSNYRTFPESLHAFLVRAGYIS
ncbi:hypothetical protein [Sphingomonas sp. dw_22]|uniref:hypothetical protein n=1 Tax=Sphingomonas sp. dw_22 TaxID=2721175 RepID=UPI001BD4ED10|nr:hypothetical protein [Sphingomonas sp. dw_22]